MRINSLNPHSDPLTDKETEAQSGLAISPGGREGVGGEDGATERPWGANSRTGVAPGGWGPVILGRESPHRPPDGDTVLEAVAEVVGLEGVPMGEAHEAPVRPLKIHLQFQIVEANPQLLHLWGAEEERGEETWRGQPQPPAGEEGTVPVPPGQGGAGIGRPCPPSQTGRGRAAPHLA